MEKHAGNDYVGVIIAESLAKKAVLRRVEITQTAIEPVTESHQTPWLAQWTLHTVVISENQVEQFAEEISQALDPEHGGSWYADFRNVHFHYVIFRNRVFKVDRSKPEQYAQVKQYGLSLGIPDYQLDFSPIIQEREG